MTDTNQITTIETPKGKIFKMVVEKYIPLLENNMATFIGTHPVGGNRMSVTGFQIKQN